MAYVAMGDTAPTVYSGAASMTQADLTKLFAAQLQAALALPPPTAADLAPCQDPSTWADMLKALGFTSTAQAASVLGVPYSGGPTPTALCLAVTMGSLAVAMGGVSPSLAVPAVKANMATILQIASKASSTRTPAPGPIAPSVAKSTVTVTSPTGGKCPPGLVWFAATSQCFPRPKMVVGADGRIAPDPDFSAKFRQGMKQASIRSVTMRTMTPGGSPVTVATVEPSAASYFVGGAAYVSGFGGPSLATAPAGTASDWIDAQVAAGKTVYMGDGGELYATANPADLGTSKVMPIAWPDPNAPSGSWWSRQSGGTKALVVGGVLAAGGLAAWALLGKKKKAA